MIAYEKQFLLKEILISNCFAFNQAISANEMRTETFMRLLTRPPNLLGGIVPLDVFKLVSCESERLLASNLSHLPVAAVQMFKFRLLF